MIPYRWNKREKPVPQNKLVIDVGLSADQLPELVRVGNWIHRDGAWLRVEQIGRDGALQVQALLSSGDLVVLSTPVTIAGDDFRPAKDPVGSLRH